MTSYETKLADPLIPETKLADPLDYFGSNYKGKIK